MNGAGGHLSLRAVLLQLTIVLSLGGCATAPTPVMPADEDYDPDPYVTPPPTPLVESPPLEPIEPPLLPPVIIAPPAPVNPSPEPSQASTTATAPAAPASTVLPATPPEPTEDQQMIALLADLQRYGTLQNDELKREIAFATQALAKQRTDANRVRLAVLYTLLRSSPQDDQRALQLFDNVAKNAPATSPIRHLAGVLQVQVTERQHAVREEQQKADAAIQKLEALRAMERSLLRDRVRSGGGGGGSAGAGGSGR
ncbi:MAG TPA: hypothetical protein VLI21_11530 [Casimicrobiaceae bacterium]|nr:hypothetical protein [Casimicrobiaceae bacterium]